MIGSRQTTNNGDLTIGNDQNDELCDPFYPEDLKSEGVSLSRMEDRHKKTLIIKKSRRYFTGI
jgi:hypothetical protein